MNKALIPAFFLLGSIILGVSVMVPQFANAQGEQKVNEQQMQALQLFFNAQNPSNTGNNQQTETSSANSQASQVQTQQVEQQKANNNNNNNNQQVTTTSSNPQTENIQKVREIQQPTTGSLLIKCSTRSTNNF